MFFRGLTKILMGHDHKFLKGAGEGGMGRYIPLLVPPPPPPKNVINIYITKLLGPVNTNQ